MDSESYQRATEVFLAALNQPREARAEFVRAACESKPGLVEVVLGMLECDEAFERSFDGAHSATLLGLAGLPGNVELPTDPRMLEWIDRIRRKLTDPERPIKRYERGPELARGGMGRVLRVRASDLNRRIAMKVLSRRDPRVGLSSEELDDDPRRFTRFIEEAQITAQLDHPGVVPVHDIGLDAEGRLYFTMKLVDGRTLAEVIDLSTRGDVHWSTIRVLQSIRDVCNAMAYAHDKGVVHRDLKPSNIMVGRYGETFVMDWGLARLVPSASDSEPVTPYPIAKPEAPRSETEDEDGRASQLSLDGAVVGTPAYMSPEQAAGKSEAVGRATDIYAVGAILYHLLVGRMPYVGEGESTDAITLLERVTHGALVPLERAAPKAPPELVAICQKAMARDAAERYSSMAHLAADLQAFLEGRVVAAYEAGPLAEARKWVGRNRIAAGFLLLTLLAIFGGLLLNAATQRRATREVRLSSDTYLVEYLIEAEPSLWPASAGTIPDIERWLADARSLTTRERQHERRLSVLVGEGGDPVAIGRERAFSASMKELQGLMPQVEGRLESARSLADRSINGDQARLAWAEAIEGIDSSGIYAGSFEGRALAPQLGLLPLGPDSSSGLWEFAHLPTGAPPVRDEQGRLVLREETGVVLILVPGGEFRMGALRPSDERGIGEPNVFSGASPMEGPVQSVRLDPFFLSKYEMTQAQWERIAGDNPSYMRPPRVVSGSTFTRLHPVESITGEHALEILSRAELTLPTEAQWEYAARGGTSTPWWTGGDVASIQGAGNIYDRSGHENGGPPNWPHEAELSDGYLNHAPVGQFRANPFGLHDVIGNVWEWCLDRLAPYAAYERGPLPGNGLREGTSQGYSHAFRGGAFYNLAGAASSSARLPMPSFLAAFGVRPARGIDPPGAR
jgi:serine/threonine protein kinase/formylglycine-generating enzyme required for sulfatase activity